VSALMQRRQAHQLMRWKTAFLPLFFFLRTVRPGESIIPSLPGASAPAGTLLLGGPVTSATAIPSDTKIKEGADMGLAG
jgi:hypothetical protein